MRLTEIEAEAKRRQGWRSEPGHNYPTVTIDRDVFFLVTRAAKQLGARLQELHKWNRIDYGFVDDDVLELIDETD